MNRPKSFCTCAGAVCALALFTVACAPVGYAPGYVTQTGYVAQPLYATGYSYSYAQPVYTNCGIYDISDPEHTGYSFNASYPYCQSYYYDAGYVVASLYMTNED